MSSMLRAPLHARSSASEETFQELVAVTCRERSTVKAGKGGHVSKETLKNVVRGPGL